LQELKLRADGGDRAVDLCCVWHFDFFLARFGGDLGRGYVEGKLDKVLFFCGVELMRCSYLQLDKHSMSQQEKKVPHQPHYVTTEFCPFPPP
jgi:hypothetical protein